MQLSFVTFGSLPVGSYFHIRGMEWVKVSEDHESDRVKFNAYTVRADGQQKTSTALFYKETLVQNDPERPLALRAHSSETNA